MQPEVKEFLVIVPTEDPGPPPAGAAIQADLEIAFPGFKFSVVGSADMRPTDATSETTFIVDEAMVLPVMSHSSSDPVRGAMIMNTAPPADLVEAIAKRLKAHEAGKLTN